MVGVECGLAGNFGTLFNYVFIGVHFWRWVPDATFGRFLNDLALPPPMNGLTPQFLAPANPFCTETTSGRRGMVIAAADDYVIMIQPREALTSDQHRPPCFQQMRIFSLSIRFYCGPAFLGLLSSCCYCCCSTDASILITGLLPLTQFNMYHNDGAKECAGEHSSLCDRSSTLIHSVSGSEPAGKWFRVKLCERSEMLSRERRLQLAEELFRKHFLPHEITFA